MPKFKVQEGLLGNRINKDLQSFLLPLNLTHAIMLQSKFIIRNHFIYPNGNLGKAMCAALTIFYILSMCYLRLEWPVEEDTAAIMVLSSLLPLLDAIALSILFIANFYNADKNVTVFLKIQSARIAMNTKSNLTNMIYENWIGSATITLFLITLTLSMLAASIEKLTLGTIMNNSIVMHYDMTMIFAMQTTKLLRKCVEDWIIYLKLQSVMDEHTDDSRTYEVQKVVNAYSDLIESFNALKSVVAVPVMLYLMIIFIQYMFFVEWFIQYGKAPDHSAIDYFLDYMKLLSMTWITKNFAFVCLVSFECDKLYRSIAIADLECVILLKTNTYSENQKQVFKNVLRLNKSCFTKMAPCSMFILDASLILKFGSLITTYTIVLLQSAYL